MDAVKRTQLSRMDVPSLVGTYRTAALEHGRATDEGDRREANRNAKTILKIRAELQARGEQQAVLQLLDDPDPWVRCSAAGAALSFAPESGERVLEELAKGPRGFLRFDAEMALREWRRRTTPNRQAD